jgi:hypothetical protein
MVRREDVRCRDGVRATGGPKPRSALIMIRHIVLAVLVLGELAGAVSVVGVQPAAACGAKSGA